MQAPDPAIFTPTATNPPTLGLASHLIGGGGGGGGGGRRGTSQQRARARPPTLSAATSSTPHSAPPSAPSSALPSALPSAPPSAPIVEQRIVFIGALAVAEWATDKEASYEPIKEFVKVTFAASDKLDYTQFYWKFLLAARRTHNPTLKAASERAGNGRWTIAANHIHDLASKKPIKALLWLSEWHERRTVASIIHIEGWETAKDQDLRNLPATSYPITICWIPPSDQSDDSLVRSGREETAFTIDGEVFTFNQRLISPPIERASTPHRRGISEVTPRPEREEEDRQTRPTKKLDLVGEAGTQGPDAPAVADALAEAEAEEAPAPAQAEAEIETGPTRRSQRQRKAPTRH
jgi:hypothetical protein